MTIRAVFFDMGGTLQTFSYTHALRLAATPGLQQRLLAAGIDLQLDNQALYDLVSSGLARYHQWSVHSLLELPPLQVWRDYVLAGLPVDLSGLETAAEDLMNYVETCYYRREMRPEAPQVLAAIRRMGLKIGLISNVCGRRQVPENLQEYGIAPYFDPVVLSSEYGRRKPDPAIFHYAARLANLPTSACLYVGDRIARDIIGARKAGYGKAVLIPHDFKHGEADEGATPDAVIADLSGLLDILEEDARRPSAAFPAPPPGLRAVLFDAGDILYYRPERGARLRQFLQELGLQNGQSCSEERDALTQQAYRGQISQEQYRQAVLRLYGVQQPDQLARGQEVLAEEDDAVCFFDGVRQTLLELKRQGCLLGIITDTANSISGKLRWFEHGGFGHVWDAIISSQEIGVRKPDPRIYQAALQQLGVTPAQAVFVGHKCSELDGARAVGLRTVAFNHDEGAQADIFIAHFSELLQLPAVTEQVK